MSKITWIFCLIMAFCVCEVPVFSQDSSEEEEEKKLKLYGDFRFRAEQDWDSKRSNGTTRNDRFRLRHRTRVGFTYQWSDHISFGARLRTGSLLDQQSPHITFGNEFEPGSIGLDKAFLSGKYDQFWWWVGKNSFPFWKQNELWWDDDVSPEGIALGWNIPSSDQFTIKPTLGYFIVRDATEDEPSLVAVQIAVDGRLDKINLNFGTGFFSFSNMPEVPEGGSYQLDYRFINSGVKLGLKTATPLSFGLDYMVNLTDYDTNNDIPVNFRDQTNGFVANATLGSLSDEGDFLVAYYYAKVAKLAVVDYFAQDDWVRWSFNGSAGTRSSNFQGHELRFAYAFGSTFNTVLRMYFVKGVEPVNDMSEKETGNRIRLDFNIKF